MARTDSGARHHLIAACAAAAQSAMDGAVLAVDLPGSEAKAEVEVFPGTRGGRTVTAEERDRLARNTIAELRQRLARLVGLYPTGSGEIVLDEDLLEEAGEGRSS